MRKLLFIFFCFSLLCVTEIKGQTNNVPFTLDDRDRIIRLEEKVESLRNEMNAKFEVQNDKINEIKTFLFCVLNLYVG